MNEIINILKKRKSVPLDQYINIALYNKKFGYYMKKNPFGRKGDFITSPLISSLFGEMLTLWCVAFWENQKKPKKILLVDLGPGDGSLSQDILKTSKKFKNFYNSLEIKLFEISNKIKNKKVEWIDSIEQLEDGPIIFIGNEFFDSLPIKQIYKKKEIFFEKYIVMNNNKSIQFKLKKLKKTFADKIRHTNLKSFKNPVEYPFQGIKYLEKIAKKINKFDGALLIIDYGYLNNGNGNTLQSVKNHSYGKILSVPGNADITSHLNFKLFERILVAKNLYVQKIVTQSEFLQRMGILKRAEILSKKMTFRSKADMFYRLKRLLDTKEMGGLFKVMLAQKKNNNFSLGF